MSRKVSAGILAVFAIFGLYILHRHRAPTKYLHVSESQHPTAPDFSLPVLTGGTLSLSQYRGKVVLLDFWATWCEPCRQEIPRFIELQNKYRDQGFQIIGVSMDDTEEPVREFLKEFRVNYPVVMGNAKIGELYGGVLGLPIAFLIGPDGRIRAKHIGAVGPAYLENEIAAIVRTGQ